MAALHFSTLVVTPATIAMQPDRINGSTVVARKKPLHLSRTSILILSSLLVGMGLGYGATSDFQVHAISAGVVGVMFYLGLENRSRRQCEKAAERALARATGKLEGRIYRHILTLFPEKSGNACAAAPNSASPGCHRD